ncbi:hypothetical protein [Aquimarina rhabdastrellae]
MKTHQSLILFIFILLNQITIAQEHHKTTTDTIPFELTKHNNIAIKAILNGTDKVNLMFHTATSGITLIKEVTDKFTSMQWSQGDHVKSWGGENKSRFSKNNTLQIGNFKWSNLSIWENKNSGPTTDGKFGPNLFKDRIIEIDFDNRILILHQTLPNKIAAYQKLALQFENDFMFINGISKVGDQNYPNKFLIHSGFGGTILYDDEFVQKTKIGNQITIIDQQELKDSYGNVLKTKKGILSQFKLGKEAFENIPVGFFEGAIGRQKMSVIGGNLLKRFNLIIDAKRTHIYIKSNQLKDSPYKG